MKLSRLINLYWWMDPDGNTTRVSDTGHNLWARLHLNYLGKYDPKEDVYHQMFRFGWIRVALVNYGADNKALVFNSNPASDTSPNPRQLSALKELANKYSATELRDDTKRKRHDIDENVLTETKLRGEWWIDNHGQATYADGDVGDINHEGVVREYLEREFLDYFDIDESNKEYVNPLREYEDRIKKHFVVEGDIKTDEESEAYDNDPALYMLDVLKKRKVIKDKKQLESAFFIAYGATSRDAREYALVYWKWKRVKGEWVETWNLTSEDVKIMYRGLWDAYSDALDGDEEEGKPVFNIEVRSNNTRYYDVPIEVMKAANPMDLYQYRNKTDLEEEEKNP